MPDLEERTYFYRGLIERGTLKRPKLVEGYSANGAGGGQLQPWQTMKECRAEAKRDGLRAVFSFGRPR